MTTFREKNVHIAIYDAQDNRLDEGSPVTDCDCLDRGDLVAQAKGAAVEAIGLDYPTAARINVTRFDDDDNAIEELWFDV